MTILVGGVSFAAFFSCSMFLMAEVKKSKHKEISYAFVKTERLERELKVVKDEKEKLLKRPCDATILPKQPKIVGAFSSWPQTKRN